jgi:hypothetical protein
MAGWVKGEACCQAVHNNSRRGAYPSSPKDTCTRSKGREHTFERYRHATTNLVHSSVVKGRASKIAALARLAAAAAEAAPSAGPGGVDADRRA